MRVCRATNNFHRAVVALIFAAIVVSGCKRAPLPDGASPEAQLYVSKCGNCHTPYNPHELTAQMWDTQITMMEVKMQSAGLPPLTADDRQSILEYLKRNAGTD